MISIERGLELVLSTVKKKELPDRMPAVSVPLPDAIARVLREDIFSDRDSPPFDKSIRDGYAVRYEDVRNVPVDLLVIGESRAGFVSSATVDRGRCCEIMTGAPLPGGADAVVMVEHTERLADGRVRIERSVRQGEGILRKAAEAHKGDPILQAGRRLRAADLGVLASTGKAEVLVSEKPQVAILATGDELVGVNENPKPGQIRNSNSYTLFAQVQEAGAQPRLLGVARDDVEELRERIGRGLNQDILIVTGGVSMGKYDLVEQVFAEYGVEVLFEKVAMKPGKPTVFGHRGPTFVFGLPGNPVSTIVSFHLFVRPVIQSLLKASEVTSTFLEASLEAPVKCDPVRAALLPAHFRFEDKTYWISTVPWKGSSDLPGLARANCFVSIPQRDGVLEAGEVVKFLPMGA